MIIVFASMVLIGVGLFFKLLSPDHTKAGGAVQEGQRPEPEDSRSSPEKNAADESADEFQVFLSFRGEDTRKTFTGHLYTQLSQHVQVFIDSEDLRKGERIEQLLKKIEASKIFLPVFSKRYADSKWCLKELAKAVKCRKKILPVFFDAGPSDLKGGGSFAHAFQRHRKNTKLDQEEVGRWKSACEEAASMSGYHLQNDTAGHEAKLLKLILKEVLTLAKPELDVCEHPVGLESRVAEIKGKLLGLEVDDVRTIGIHGMGGIGKTTLAKKLYNEISEGFDGRCSFVFDVRETCGIPRRLQSLQNQIVADVSGRNEQGFITDAHRGTDAVRKAVAREKVLIVLDDVDDPDQLKALVGGSDGNWFRRGSRIIITARDKKILLQHGMEEGNMYQVDTLDDDLSMELFSYHAFVSKQPPDEEYAKLAREVVSAAEGLPLALEIFGSEFFAAQNPNGFVEKLKNYQHRKVHERLRISYDQLDDCEKQVFLDIACFFVGRDQEYPHWMWENCKFIPSSTIEVLQQKSLIKRKTLHEKRVFRMHDQIREMGRTIVLDEVSSSITPGRRSRFWDANTEQLQTLEVVVQDGCNLYTRTHLEITVSFAEVPASVQGIRFEENTTAELSCLEKHIQLRYLNAFGVHFEGSCSNQPFSAKLKWLSLSWCKFEQPPSHFRLGNGIALLELFGTKDLSQAFVEQSFRRRGEALKKLKVIDLSFTDITTTPDFTNVSCPYLEKLILFGCKKLATVHESIGQLKRLVLLNMQRCSFSILPNTLGGMKSLKELMLDWNTNLQTLPDSIGELRNLRELSLCHCPRLKRLPNSLGMLRSLHINRETPKEEGLDDIDIDTLFAWLEPMLREEDHTTDDLELG